MEKTKQKGVTLIETVVAMALVVIISVAAYTTCNFALKSQYNLDVKNFFMQETENISMCYYKSDKVVDNFENALSFVYGANNISDNIEYISSIDENNTEKITKIKFFYNNDLSLLTKENKSNAKYEIIFDFSQSKITSYNISKNKIVFERQV